MATNDEANWDLNLYGVARDGYLIAPDAEKNESL